MIQPIEPSSKEELEDRFSLSSRAAIRVGALWQKGLGVSEGVLDQSEPDSRLEALLLSSALLDAGADLTNEELERMMEDLSGDRVPEEPLAVDEQGEVPVLCLEEELLAEQAWSGTDTDEAAAVESVKADEGPAGEEGDDAVLPSETSDAQSILEEEESEPLFSDEQISELKLTVLTGVNPERKIEALRKLAFAPVDEKTQGMVFLKALTDDAPEVREEAAGCLEQLGLSETLSDAIQTFLSGDLDQKKYAGDKIKNMVEDCQPFEKAIVVALLSSEMESEDRAEVHNVIIEILQSLAPFIAENAGDHLPNLTRNILDTLVSHFHEINRSVRALYRSLGETVPEQVNDILWEEVTNVDERVLKAYLLILLGEIPCESERKREITEEMVETIRGWSDTEIVCRRLGNALIQQGSEGVEAIIDQFSEADLQQRVFLLRLLDELMIDLTPDEELQERLESFLIDITGIEDRKIREPLLDLHLLYHFTLSEETQKTLARQLLEPLHRFKNDRIGDMTPIVLEKMGRPVLPVLMEYLKDGTYDIQRDVALDVIGNVFTGIEPGELADDERQDAREHLEEFDAYLDEQIEREDKEMRTEMIVNQARALSAPLSDKERALEKIAELRERVDGKEDPYASLQGLGWLAASPLIEPDRAMETGISFLGYLDSELPEDISQDAEAETGRTLLVEKETEAYTDLIPTVLEGLTRICRREELKDSFRERICNKLLEKWHDLVDFKLVWGPGTVTQLAEHLGSLCLSPYISIDLKEELLDGLSRRVNNLSVIDIIGDVLGTGIESQKIRALCRKITMAILEMLEMPDYQDPEDRRIILENLGKICSRRNLAGDRTENKHLRKKVIDALVDGLYDQIDGVQQTLEDLAEHERVPKKYRNKIKDQLDRYSDT